MCSGAHFRACFPKYQSFLAKYFLYGFTDAVFLFNMYLGEARSKACFHCVKTLAKYCYHC